MHMYTLVLLSVIPIARISIMSLPYQTDLRHFSRELLYYPQAKIYDHTLLTKQSYAFDA